MADLGDRAADYERRLLAAGSTDALMHGLVRVVDQSHRIAIAAITAVAVGLIGGGVGLVALMSSRDAGTRSLLNQHYLAAQCAANNDARRDQRELWAFLVQTDAAAKVDAAKILDRVDRIFADRDCIQVAEGKVTPTK